MGRAMRMLTLNLSAIRQPCVRVATMVVSEMKERLSPNMAPLTTTPSIIATGRPVFAAMPTATGERATMVPTEVPTEIEMKQAARKMPAARRFSGRMAIARLTVASTAPISLAVWAKAPARMKIKTISMMLLLAAPRQNCSMRWLRLPPFDPAMATTEASTKATVMGIL